MTAYAFKCVNCGHLAEASEAGERHLPAACRYCGHGVHFDPTTGVKEYDDDNWLVLSELSEAALAKVKKHHGNIAIAEHKAPKSYVVGTSVEASAEDGLGVKPHE